MYVGFAPVSISDPEKRPVAWANPGKFVELFRELIGSPEQPRLCQLIVDGRPPPARAAFEVSHQAAYIFFAKDKRTLRDGLCDCPRSLVVVAPHGQLGFFCGSYDFERPGAWARSNILAGRKWDLLTHAHYDEFKEIRARFGMTQSDFMRMQRRVRLTERGYFMFVCPSDLLSLVSHARTFIGEVVTLGALGRMMAGLNPEEEASGLVGGLNSVFT